MRTAAAISNAPRSRSSGRQAAVITIALIRRFLLLPHFSFRLVASSSAVAHRSNKWQSIHAPLRRLLSRVMAPGAILVTSSIINLRTLTTRGGAGQYAMRDSNPGRDGMHATLVEMPLYFEVSAGWKGPLDSGWNNPGVLADVAAGRLSGVNVRSTRMPDGTWTEEPLPEGSGAGGKAGRAAALAVAAAAAKKIVGAGRGAGSASPSAAAGLASRSGDGTSTPTGAASPSRASEVSDAEAAVLPQATGGHPILGSWGGLPSQFAPVASAVAPAAVRNGCGGLGAEGTGAAAEAAARDSGAGAGSGAGGASSSGGAGKAGKLATPAKAARSSGGAGTGTGAWLGAAAASPASHTGSAAPPLSARSSGGGAFGSSSSSSSSSSHAAAAADAHSQTAPRYVMPQYLLYCSDFDSAADAVWERGGVTAAGKAVREMIGLRRIIVERDSKEWPGAGK